MSRWTVVFFGERRILPTVNLVCQLKGRGASLFECELPFDHKTLHLELEDKNFAGVMEGHQNEFKTTKSQEELGRGVTCQPLWLAFARGALCWQEGYRHH